MQQPPQQYPPPPPGYPPLSPGYPPQQPWYPPQQYVQQQPVVIQQGGYASQQYQSSGRLKIALILAIVVAVVTSLTLIFYAAALDVQHGVGLLFGWWLTHGFGLCGAGCKNTCLMMTYIVFADSIEHLEKHCDEHSTNRNCGPNLQTYYTVLAILFFIIVPLFATSAGFFIRARSEVKAQEFQRVYSGQPPVVTVTGSQTQQTA
ncbi:hypothetical protein PRIPAC_73727 [Pristionchus pacificus]|uniref:Uncharacterized protein n=1 Tax=Pristionchus pacificus TaxID=54126 RepID=A0A454XLK5_PRIPA|nr:hypothetical protein PRIPAC_73727 [Pristionchus pacificus]|eukprot:PDM72044.1 hypothetical protein PRIPAC_38451 [Pristionchus pacificus]